MQPIIGVIASSINNAPLPIFITGEMDDVDRVVHVTLDTTASIDLDITLTGKYGFPTSTSFNQDVLLNANTSEFFFEILMPENESITCLNSAVKIIDRFGQRYYIQLSSLHECP